MKKESGKRSLLRQGTSKGEREAKGREEK